MTVVPIINSFNRYLFNIQILANAITCWAAFTFRLRSGNVIFNYKYYNNMLQRTEGIVKI